MSLRALTFWILTVISLGCAGTAKPPVHLPTPESFDPKQSAVVDEAYRFRLALPGPSWTLVSMVTARALHPDVKAAALMPKKWIGAHIFVTSMEGMSLDQAVDTEMATADPAKEKRVHVTHQGLPAIDRTWTLAQQGVHLRVRSLLVAHQGYLYEVRLSAAPGGASDDAVAQYFNEASRAFTILSGKIRPPVAEVQHHVDTAGPGWRVRGGVYDDAGGALRITPPAPWRIMIDDELRQLQPDARVALQRRGPEVFIAVTVERAPAAQLETMRGRTGAAVKLATKAAWSARVGGEVVAFDEVQVDDVGTIRVFRATIGRGGRLYQLVVSAGAQGGLEHAQQGLDALQFLDAANEAALASELAALPDEETAIEGPLALWGGHFFDFEHGIRWSKPSNAWGAVIGSTAQQVNENASVAFEHSGFGVTGFLMPLEGDAADAQQVLRATLEEIVSEGRAQQTPIHPIGIDADSTGYCTVDLEVDGMQFRYLFAAARVADRGVMLSMYGLVENMAAADEEVQRATRALSLARTPLQPDSSEPGRYVSQRFGYRFDPPSGATPTGWKDGVASGAFQARTWISDRIVTSIAAMVRPGISQQSNSTLRDMMVQQFRQRFGSTALGEPVVDTLNLGGRSAYRISFVSNDQRMDLFGMLRGDQLFMLTVVQRSAGTLETAMQIASGFALLE